MAAIMPFREEIMPEFTEFKPRNRQEMIVSAIDLFRASQTSRYPPAVEVLQSLRSFERSQRIPYDALRGI
jgi:hypothetical protein